MPTTYNIADDIFYHFTIFQSDGETPLPGEEQVDFTFKMFKNASEVLSPPVTVAECGSTGTYYAHIIPLQIGKYHFRIIGNNDYIRTWHTFDFIVVDEISGLFIVERILKNRLTINAVGNEYYQQVWNDNNTEVLLQWKLFDKDGLDVIMTGRGPASRGVPSGG